MIINGKRIRVEVWDFSGNWGYSHQWWIHPYFNAYAAHGKDGQAFYVLPEEDIVVVFTAEISSADPEPYDVIILDYILSAIGVKEQLLAYMIWFPITVAGSAVIIMQVILLVKKRIRS